MSTNTKLSDPCLALWQAMNEAEKVGNRTDDKLIVKFLREAGYCIAPIAAHDAEQAQQCTCDCRSDSACLLCAYRKQWGFDTAPVEQAAPTEQAAQAVPAGFKLAPHYRGYALLGTGRYLIDSTDAPADPELGAELIISIASEKDREGREIGERRDMPARTIQPDDMAVRIGFANERGLFALEDQLWTLRQEHWPGTKSAAMLAAAPAAPAPEAQAVPALCANCAPAGKCEKRQAMCEPGMATRAAQAVPAEGPPSGYEATTPVYTRWVSPARYAKFSPKVQAWYRPYWVYPAAPAPEAQPYRMNAVEADAMNRALARSVRFVDEAQAAGQELPPYPLPQAEFNALMDHIYEHGTMAEGITTRALKLCDAYARAALAQRQPLTDEQIRLAWEQSPDPHLELECFTEGVRFAERAHGIGATTGKQQR